MKKLLTSIVIAILAILTCVQANAQALDGTYTVVQGNTVTVQIGSAYVTTLKRATNISATWTTSSSSISIQSKTNTTCTVKGVTPAEKVRLNYQCSYRYDGYARTMNFYYEITVKANTVSVNRVYVYPEESTLNVDETVQLTTEIYPTNATNKNLRWQTDDYSVASVSTSGLVTARGAGKVKIWAYAQDGSGAADYCTVTVNEPTKVESIELDKSTLSMTEGEISVLVASVSPSEAYNKTLQWSSSNNEIASVQNGEITAVSPGECDIVCSATDGSNVSATCHVTVEESPRKWLTILAPNGSYSMETTSLDEVPLRINPEKGYKIHSVMLNGEDVTNNLVSNTLTVPTLNDATVNVVFAEDGLSTAINEIDSDRNAIKVSVSNGTVNVSGIQQGSIVTVYDLNGIMVKTTSEQSFTLPKNRTYVIKIDSCSYKIVI